MSWQGPYYRGAAKKRRDRKKREAQIRAVFTPPEKRRAAREGRDA